jgi:enoyl-CoA hydratase/carnithine racemase
MPTTRQPAPLGVTPIGDLTLLRVALDERVLHVTIHRPPINLFDGQLLVELDKVGTWAAGSADVGAVVMDSSVADFWIAHFDVAAILRFPTDRPPAHELGLFTRVCEHFRTMPKLTVAVIDGRVGGGGSELAMSFDVRYVSESAVFNQPEVALGILPGGGGTQRLPRLIGRSRAMEAILGCEDIDARTAERWGWVNRVYPTGAAALDSATALARRAASFPPHAVAEAKSCVLRAEHDLPTDLLEEIRAFARTIGHERAIAAMRSFLEHGGQTPEGERRLGALVTELT